MEYRALVLGSLALVVLPVPGLSGVSYGACPEEWLQWKGSCYKSLYPKSAEWQGAVESCSDLDGHLVTPNSIEEYDFLWNNFNPGSELNNGVWIGCTDEDGDGVWECIGDASEDPYRAEWWSSPSSDRRCSVFSVEHSKWNAWPCDDTEKYVMCERPVPVFTDSVSCSIVATDRCLPDRTLKTVTVRGRLQCCLACHKDQRCRSFNLRGSQCELNEAAHDVQLLVSDGGCVHYEL